MSTEPTIPELTKHQVDRMYDHITAQIDLDTRARRTKRRKNVLVAASVVAVLGLGGTVVAGTLPGLMQPNQSSDSGAYPQATPESASRGDSAAMEGSADGDAGADSAGAGAGTEDVAGEREIITTASATLTVDDPSSVATELGRWTEGVGGRVESRSEYSSGDVDVTTVRLRVPSGQTTAATDRLRDAGELTNLSISSEDVTAQAVDLDARIGALETSVERLRTLMSEASTTADLLRAEETLADRQGQLESLQAQRRALSGQVAMATYDVELRTDGPEKSDDRSGFLGGLESGWNGLVAVVGVAVAALGFLLPWLVLLAVLVGAALGVRRVVRR